MLFMELSDLTGAERKSLLDRRSGIDEVMGSVREVLLDVDQRGDEALREYTKRFDGADLEELEVTDEEWDDAFEKVDESLIEHLEIATSRIRLFHERQLPPPLWLDEMGEDILLGQKTSPIPRVGAYVPGGTAAYPSTALMTLIPARVAGVGEVVMCTPPRTDGTIHPLTLVAAGMAGADRVLKLGGAQAIAAMAYGTQTVPQVDKIVGPGNVYVTAAKIIVREQVEIDFPAGPSEVLIIADETADPRCIASDMIAQAEHDPNAVSVLLATTTDMARAVNNEVERMAESAMRDKTIQQSLSRGAILVAPLGDAIKFSNEFGPEHLEIITREPMQVLEKIASAGSIFIGNYAPVAAGDYASGTNHVLPTAGGSRVHGGLSVDHFIKKSSVQVISKEGLESIKDVIIDLAEEEGLRAHADSVRVRFE